MFIVKKNTRIIIATLAIVISGIAAILGWTYLAQKTSAADMSKFDPGNIMSDAVMSNKDSMSVQQIQAFLNSKNACNNTNTYMASWYPHLQYTIRDGKFVCMAQDTFNGKSAAQIIWQVGQDYNINPQFLIVLLEKEQGLVTDTWPNHIQYRSATGFGCPDTAACDSRYFGLENQLVNAANLFRTVLNGGWSNYPVGWTYVQYNPNASCGGKVINIQNRATSALYRYTPYQPNASALAAGYGLGDNCGAYGNRNTWALFTDWFGTTQSLIYSSMESSRWMQVSKSTTKINLHSGEPAGNILIKGQQIKFVDKAYFNNELYLRTEFNYSDGGDFGVRFADLVEIPFEPIEPEWKIINYDGVHRYIPNSEKWMINDGSLSIGTVLNVTSKITINGVTSYRTKYNTDNNQNAAFREERLDNLTYTLPLETPRIMTALFETRLTKINGDFCQILPQYTPFDIKGKFVFNGKTYFSEIESPVDINKHCFIKADDLNLSPIRFEPFDSPRNMKLTQNVSRLNLDTGKIVDILQAGSVIHFSSKTTYGGQTYFRTTHNTVSNGPFGVPAKYVTDN